MSSVLAVNNIDPSKSPFARGMTAAEATALRKQLPGTPRTPSSNNSNSNDPLELEVSTLRNANRDARLAALSMLNE